MNPFSWGAITSCLLCIFADLQRYYWIFAALFTIPIPEKPGENQLNHHTLGFNASMVV